MLDMNRPNYRSGFTVELLFVPRFFRWRRRLVEEEEEEEEEVVVVLLLLLTAPPRANPMPGCGKVSYVFAVAVTQRC
jgi:hypothetical protein